MSSANGARRWGDAAARLAAVIGGILLTASALLSYFVAGYADEAIEAGTGAAEDALRSGESGVDGRTAEEAADWANRLSEWLVNGRPDQFRTYALIAAAAGVVAIVAALPRRPEAVWPEVVWVVSAVAGLVPNLAFDLWFGIWTFTGSLIAAAPVIHYLARRDDHTRRAAAATRRAGAAAAPRVNAALARGTRAAADAWSRTRGDGNGSPPATGAKPAPMPTAAGAAGPAAPPGWYADPQGQGDQRYWNGSAWTAHVS